MPRCRQHLIQRLTLSCAETRCRLRPLNVETLATYIYQFATRGSFEQGSLATLIIVAVGILPVIRITRYADIATRLTLDARS